MQQRKSTFGRPSGTDGSDYSYRMVVDSTIDPLVCGLMGLCVIPFRVSTGCKGEEAPLSAIYHSGIEKDNLNAVAFSSAIVNVISLIIAEIGRRRSRPSLLRIYAVVSSIAMLLLIASLAKQYSLLKAIQDFSFGGTRKFDVDDFPGFQAGLLVYIFTLSVFKICTIKAVASLLFNMSPPKKAS